MPFDAFFDIGNLVQIQQVEANKLQPEHFKHP